MNFLLNLDEINYDLFRKIKENKISDFILKF